MRVNLRGAYLVLREAVRVMLGQSHGGAVVNTAWVASFKATQASAIYSTSKGGVLMMTRQAALEFVARGLRINVVCPKTIDTRMLTSAPQEVRDALAVAVPMARLGRPAEVAAAEAFPASDDASYMTGGSTAG